MKTAFKYISLAVLCAAALACNKDDSAEVNGTTGDEIILSSSVAKVELTEETTKAPSEVTSMTRPLVSMFSSDMSRSWWMNVVPTGSATEQHTGKYWPTNNTSTKYYFSAANHIFADAGNGLGRLDIESCNADWVVATAYSGKAASVSLNFYHILTRIADFQVYLNDDLIDEGWELTMLSPITTEVTVGNASYDIYEDEWYTDAGSTFREISQELSRVDRYTWSTDGIDEWIIGTYLGLHFSYRLTGSGVSYDYTVDVDTDYDLADYKGFRLTLGVELNGSPVKAGEHAANLTVTLLPWDETTQRADAE